MTAPLPTINPNDYSWLEEFRAFTSFHWLMLGICIGSFVAFCVVGKALLRMDLRDAGHREETFRRWLAWSIIGSQGFFFVRRFTPGQWDLQDSLPLHMCRWTVWIAAWAMLTLNPRARALLLFWGIGLSTQGLFTPFLDHGLLEMGFWIYWLNHVQIVGAGVYDIVVLKYRPTARHLGLACLAGVGFVVLVFTLNALLGTNYSYLGDGQHNGRSIVDELGPYPIRALWMTLGSMFVFVLIYGVSRLLLFVRVRVLGKPPPRMIGPRERPNATLCP